MRKTLLWMLIDASYGRLSARASRSKTMLELADKMARERLDLLAHIPPCGHFTGTCTYFHLAPYAMGMDRVVC